jgi:LppP/LprE lipoprotein
MVYTEWRRAKAQAVLERSGMARLLSIVAGALVLALTFLPGDAGADGAWLDGPVANWNTPGMAIPPAPPTDPSVNPRCPAGRPPATPREQAVVDAGWKLYGNFSQGGAVEEMSGLAGYDGMCRPMQYQIFYFVDQKFAGTLSPVTMDSRTDGALNSVAMVNDQTVTARYARYTFQDALCCPSAMSTAIFEIDRAGSAPIVSLKSVSTEPTGSQPPSPGPSPSPAPIVTASPAPIQAPAQLPRRP